MPLPVLPNDSVNASCQRPAGGRPDFFLHAWAVERVGRNLTGHVGDCPEPETGDAQSAWLHHVIRVSTMACNSLTSNAST